MSGHGRVPPHIATLTFRTKCWKWSAGKSAGRRPGGVSIWQRENRPRMSACCATARTRVDRSEPPNSLLRSNKRLCGGSPREGEGGPKSPQLIPVSTALLLLPSFQENWATSCLSGSGLPPRVCPRLFDARFHLKRVFGSEFTR